MKSTVGLSVETHAFISSMKQNNLHGVILSPTYRLSNDNNDNKCVSAPRPRP